MPINNTKIDDFYSFIKEIFKRVLKKGFYGKVKFCLNIQDGKIQDFEKEEIEKHR